MRLEIAILDLAIGLAVFLGERGFVSVWCNDNGNGPARSSRNCPFVIAGGASGFLRQGQFLHPGDELTHARVLNTIGSAAGLRNAQGGNIDDFGDPSLPRTVVDELLA